jgi:hypothetical protein
MAEQMYAPQAVLHVQEHLNELIDSYAEQRSAGSAPHEAVLASFCAVFSPAEMIDLVQFIGGKSDEILGEGAGTKFVADMESFFEERTQIKDDAEDWQQQYMVEIDRRATMDIVACAEAWAMDDVAAVMCANAYGSGDREAGDYILFGATNMIIGVVTQARTKTGRRIKLDQAIKVLEIVRNKNLENKAVAGWCQMLVSCLQQASP